MEKFTIEEFKKYLLSKDSMGDILYFLSEENVRKANEIEKDENEWIEPEFTEEEMKDWLR